MLHHLILVLPIKFVQPLDATHAQEVHTQIPQDPTVRNPHLLLQSHPRHAMEIKSLIAKVNVLNVVQALSQTVIEHHVSTIPQHLLQQLLVPIIKLSPLVVLVQLAQVVKFQMLLKHTVNAQLVHQ